MADACSPRNVNNIDALFALYLVTEYSEIHPTPPRESVNQHTVRENPGMICEIYLTWVAPGFTITHPVFSVAFIIGTCPDEI